MIGALVLLGFLLVAFGWVASCFVRAWWEGRSRPGRSWPWVR